LNVRCLKGDTFVTKPAPKKKESNERSSAGPDITMGNCCCPESDENVALTNGGGRRQQAFQGEVRERPMMGDVGTFSNYN
jgi:hypothetical protein